MPTQKKINEYEEITSPPSTYYALLDDGSGNYYKCQLGNLPGGGGGGGDTTSPVFVSGVVENATPNIIDLTFDENISGGMAGWSATKNGSPWSISGGSVSGMVLSLTMSSNAAFGDVIEVSYNPGPGNTQDLAGNELATITDTGVTNNVGGSYDADAQAYFDVLTSPSVGYKDATNDLIVALKAAGVWSKLDALWLFRHGTTFSQKKWNVKNPLDTDGAFRLVENGGFTYAATGAAGNGTSGWFDTKYEISVHGTLNSSAAGFYCNTDSDGAYVDMGCTDGANYFQVIGSYSENAYFDSYQNSAPGRFTVAQTASNGFFIGTRQSSVLAKMFRNGTQLGSTLTTGGGALPVSRLLGLLVNNDGTTPTGHSAREYSLFFVGDGLSDAECADFNTAVQTWIAAT